jgi:D-alanine-D-alanine ligase
MAKDQTNLLLIYGGVSPEHEVSVNSAKFIGNYIDRSKYNLFIIKISKQNRWLYEKEFNQPDSKSVEINL